MGGPSKGSLISLSGEGGGSHSILKSKWEIEGLIQLVKGGGSHPIPKSCEIETTVKVIWFHHLISFWGVTPPPPSNCIMKIEGGGGGHTSFWIHGERWTTLYFESPLGEIPHHKLKVFYSSFLKRAKKSSSKLTSSFDLLANFRRRSLKKVCSCLKASICASDAYHENGGRILSQFREKTALASISIREGGGGREAFSEKEAEETLFIRRNRSILPLPLEKRLACLFSPPRNSTQFQRKNFLYPPILASSNRAFKPSRKRGDQHSYKLYIPFNLEIVFCSKHYGIHTSIYFGT